MRGIITTLVLAVGLTAGGQALAAPMNCPMASARYALMGYPNFTAAFQPLPSRPGWTSDVALQVKADGQSYWFMFDQAGAAGDLSLAATSDPTRPGWRPPGMSEMSGQEAAYFGLDADFAFTTSAPLAGAPAPQYILAPEMPALVAAAPHAPGQGRIRMPKAMFKLVSCQSQVASVDR